MPWNDVPSHATATAFVPPVLWSALDVTTKDVGLPLKPVNEIEDAEADRVVVFVPTVTVPPPPPLTLTVTLAKLVTS
jgi:hypothetical protein